MADGTGVELPPRISPGMLGNRWLGVIPIAQATVIGEVLVQLIAIERRSKGAILTARLSRLEETILTEPVNGLPWPKLLMTATDHLGTGYRFDGGPGIGSESDWDVDYGMVGAIPNTARRLELTITELIWEDMHTGTAASRTTGTWTFNLDLTRQTDARMV